MPALPKIDEFAFVLMAGVLLIFILAFAWTTPTEGPPVLSKTYLEITADQGETTTFDFSVSGTTALTSVNFTASGEIATWITFNKNDFDVQEGESTTVTATLKLPSDISVGIYNGHVNVKSSGGTDRFSISVDVVEERIETSTRVVPSNEFPQEFSVSYSEGTDVLDSREDISVAKGYFSGRSMELTGLITAEKLSITTGGSVHLIIEDTNKIGSLIVSINGHEIYNKIVSAGEIFIPIEKNLIERSNIVTIGAGSPGWKFWTSTVYNIISAEFGVDYDGAFAQAYNISMTNKEVDNFKQFDLYYRVRGYDTPLADLMIKINNQVVYWDMPPLAFFDMSFDEDMFGNPLYLNEGTNTVTFLFEEEASYTMADAMLTIEYYD